MQSFLSPSGPPRLAPGSHSHPGFVCQAPGCPLPVQASKATTRHPRLQPANLCPIPVLQGEEQRVGRERGLSTDEC